MYHYERKYKDPLDLRIDVLTVLAFPSRVAAPNVSETPRLLEELALHLTQNLTEFM